MCAPGRPGEFDSRRSGEHGPYEVVTSMQSTVPTSALHRAVPSSPAVSERMSRVRNRDTSPELALRSELHRRGLRFRVHFPLVIDPRRKADVAFRTERVAVFVDGCFWHSCPQHATQPKANADFWRDKLARNRRRDIETDDRLKRVGWLAVRVWEHEEPCAAADTIEAVLHQRRLTTAVVRARIG